MGSNEFLLTELNDWPEQMPAQCSFVTTYSLGFIFDEHYQLHPNLAILILWAREEVSMCLPN